MENEPVKKPLIIRKLISHMDILEQNIQTHKVTLDKITSEIKLLRNDLDKYIQKNTKKTVISSEKKPKGFAIPVKISNEMCEFLEMEPETIIARTEVTKLVNQYIQTNNLKNSDKKTVINPDEKLGKLLGDYEEEITFFNIQRHLNRHFIKEQPDKKYK